MNELCPIWMSRVTRGRVVSHINDSCLIWMSGVTYEWVVSHMIESCHIWLVGARVGTCRAVATMCWLYTWSYHDCQMIPTNMDDPYEYGSRFQRASPREPAHRTHTQTHTHLHTLSTHVATPQAQKGRWSVWGEWVGVIGGVREVHVPQSKQTNP